MSKLGLSLCLKLREEPSLDILQSTGLDAEMLKGTDKKLFTAITKHFRAYGKMPEWETVLEEVEFDPDTLPKAKEPARYYADAIVKLAALNAQREWMHKQAEALKDQDPVAFVEAAKGAIRDANERFHLGGGALVDLTKNGAARLAEYEKLEGVDNGITGIRSPWDILDEITQGWKPGDLITVVGRTGTGKCLGRGTPVIRADGCVVPVEAVRRGDRLIGPDGTVRNVLSTTRGSGPLFRIEPVKGEPWVCNDVHVLTLVKTDTDEIVDIALDKWHAASAKFKHTHKQFSCGVDSWHDDPGALDVDPYFLGVWFGDGTKFIVESADGLRQLDRVAISKPDPEVRDLCHATATQWGLNVRDYRGSDGQKCPTYSIVAEKGKSNSLLTAMRQLVGDAVTVPGAILRGDRARRMAFLAGFIDADGELSGNGFVVVQKREDWARAVWWIARSLGFCATFKARQAQDQHGNGGTYFVVSISGETDQIPVRLPRRKAGPRRQKKVATRTGFDVVPIGVGDYFGFTLDGDGRFLLGDFTVTHNTFDALLNADAAHQQGYSVGFISMEMPANVIGRRRDAIRWKLPYNDFKRGKLDQEAKERWKAGILEQTSEDEARWLVAGNDRIETVDDVEMFVEQTGVKFLVVDGFYLLQDEKARSDWDRVTRAIRRLRKLALKRLIAIMVTTQTTKGDKKGEKTSVGLDDVAFADTINQESAIVKTLYQGPDEKNRGEMCHRLRKNREGELLDFVSAWDFEAMDFSVLEGASPADEAADDRPDKKTRGRKKEEEIPF